MSSLDPRFYSLLVGDLVSRRRCLRLLERGDQAINLEDIAWDSCGLIRSHPTFLSNVGWMRHSPMLLFNQIHVPLVDQNT